MREIIAEELESHGIEISQDVKDMIDTYGNNPMNNPFEADNYIRNFITVTYNFITAVLSGYYDTMNMGFDIVDGILKLAAGEDVNNSYIRSISYGG